MKFFKSLLWIALTCSLSTAQTFNLGQNVFFNEEGVINLAVDAAVAVRNLDSPYVMFMLFMGADEGAIANISRDNILLVHNNQTYKMPSFKEFRKNYNKDNLDLNLYKRLGKDSLILSKMRWYRFQTAYDFFPARGQNVRITDEGEIVGREGFQTKAYFKNPGFKAGDKIIIKVIDTKNSEIWGAAAVEL
ncbi:MAG: hypothetical protein GQ544_09470 [Candidatus Aminicenantes bacterium]|nr:hypothetical protein [Candidatus Aminicenantes bacterium]